MSDADAFERFLREYQDMVFATAVRLLGREADAEDVAQTVFLKAYERFDALRANPAAPGWLKTVTTNACLNHLQRHRRRWRLFSEMERPSDARGIGMLPGLGFVAALATPANAAPDVVIQRASDAAALESAVRRLPDHQRVPLVLFHFEDRSYQEIAALLRVSIGKVKTDIFRARQALRRFIEPERTDGSR